MKASPPAKRNDRIIHETGLTFHTKKYKMKGAQGYTNFHIVLFSENISNLVVGEKKSKKYRAVLYK